MREPSALRPQSQNCGHVDQSSATEGVACHLEINILFHQNSLLCFIKLSVSNISKCKKDLWEKFGTVQNVFRDVSGTVVKKVHF